ncbi:alpha/beta hydrolase family esterase [Actinomadura rugatobispora]|uniref:Alpha/beta hydrolase family esterase n=1 Tax=Actinomadura rugatobispora TaxID=1994 RepID=A0ABW1A133_9ACTN|nr:PHB depolymerase family esterase [Actinomadura rugatobispora]
MRRPLAPALAHTATAVALALLTAAGCSALPGGSGDRGPANGNGGAVGRPAAPVPQASVPAGRRPAVPSTGCRAAQAAPATGRHTFAGRSYLLKRPNTDPRRPAPLILDLHGLHSSGFQQALYSQMATVGSARGFIVVEPDSAPGREGWKLPGMPDGSADVAYMGRLLDHLESALCVDRAHEFATGFSNGAGLATALICGLDGRLAGVAPIAGFNLARPCAGARPTTVVAFHGTADRIIPYRGGEPYGGDRTRIPPWMRPSDGAFALPSVRTAAARWARALGCRTTGDGARNVQSGGEIGRLSYQRCKGGARLDLYTVADGGHTWPGTMPIGLGKTTTRLNATSTILDAFSRT